MKRILPVADVPGWAWDRKAQNLKRWLHGDEFHVEIAYHQQGPVPAKGIDLYHTFEFPQVDRMPVNSRVVTGLTAHVWKTWGEEPVRRWCRRAVGVHANSLLLQKELEPLAGKKVWYTPNGVDPEVFKRTRPRAEGRLVIGHVGKPNPRKGAHLIQEACNNLGLELRLIQRRYSEALSVDEMVEWYQGIDVMCTASDMDGTPNPLLEGAACECAIVSTAIGNMPEFITRGVNGFLVERSVEALQDALGAIDEESAVEMGVNARKEVLGGWTWERQAEHVRAMWREVA